MTEYRIEYAIQRRAEGEEDFTEIGFGSSGGNRTLDGCLYAIESDVGNGLWETQPGHPDPDAVVAEIAASKADA